MSGLIGGAGSKSGVIGTTELDYEEGTWTPVIKSNETNTISVGGPVTVLSTYTKIGDICYFVLEIANGTLSGTTASGSQRIEGLPFTSSVRTATSRLSQYGSLFTTAVTGLIQRNTSNLELVTSGSAIQYAAATFNNTTTGTYWMISGTYKIA